MAGADCPFAERRIHSRIRGSNASNLPANVRIIPTYECRTENRNKLHVLRHLRLPTSHKNGEHAYHNMDLGFGNSDPASSHDPPCPHCEGHLAPYNQRATHDKMRRGGVSRTGPPVGSKLQYTKDTRFRCANTRWESDWKDDWTLAQCSIW